MTQLAYLLAALSLSLLTACSSKDASLSQQPEDKKDQSKITSSTYKNKKSK